MQKVYVGTSLLEKEIAQSIIADLTSCGYQVTYDWTTHGRLTNLEQLKECCYKEMDGVTNCDLFFMYFPARFGTHVELGIALALNKHIVLVVDRSNPNFDKSNFEEKTFYQADNIKRFDQLTAAIEYAKSIFKEKT